MSLLERSRAALLVVDVQEGFRPAIEGFDRIVERCAILVRGATVLDLEVLATEQYPQGLKATVAEIAEQLTAPPLPKTVFSAARAEGFELPSEQVLVCGIEAHVCVSQTVHDLLDRGHEVHVAADATSSRTAQECERALSRMERAGATITTAEAALFELLGAAGTPEFKEVQRLIL
ncbi:MAG: isochorismatase family protein [Solirubrobacteraceae bacterium]